MKTRLLLINCYHEKADEKIVPYQEWLEAGGSAAGLEVELLTAMDDGPLPEGTEYDAVVLSGSHKMIGGRGQIEDGLIRFLKGCRRPLLGICYGHQALCRAFGGTVRKDAEFHGNDETIRLVGSDGLFSGISGSFQMSESHYEIVSRDEALERSFRVLAESGSSLIEAVRYRERLLYGVQFHPERSGEAGKKLLANFLAVVAAYKAGLG